MIRIEPYKDDEVNKVLLELLSDNDFLSFVKSNLNKSTSKFLSIPGSSFLAMQLFKSKIKKLHTIKDFQQQVKAVLASVVKQTITDFTTEGLNKLDKNKPYLFIGNHRDITLDSALCNHAIDSIGMDTTYNAIGDNLVSIKWMGDLLRLNKSFVIARSGDSKKEIYMNLFKASDFIAQRLSANESVWIAQKQGRSKDGRDKTDPAVLKMLHIALRKKCAFEDISKHYNIIPCSISYEIDPLAAEKTKQSLNNETKSKNDDISHIFKGVMMPKGRVHLTFCPPVLGTFSPEELANEIDKSIINNFKIWDTNIYAYQALYETVNDDEFPSASKYFNDMRSSMTNDELGDIMSQYANPIIAKKELNNE